MKHALSSLQPTTKYKHNAAKILERRLFSIMQHRMRMALARMRTAPQRVAPPSSAGSEPSVLATSSDSETLASAQHTQQPRRPSKTTTTTMLPLGSGKGTGAAASHTVPHDLSPLSTPRQTVVAKIELMMPEVPDCSLQDPSTRRPSPSEGRRASATPDLQRFRHHVSPATNRPVSGQPGGRPSSERSRNSAFAYSVTNWLNTRGGGLSNLEASEPQGNFRRPSSSLSGTRACTGGDPVHTTPLVAGNSNAGSLENTLGNSRGSLENTLGISRTQNGRRAPPASAWSSPRSHSRLNSLSRAYEK